MEKDFNSWFHHQISDQQSSYFNSLSSLLNLGQQNTVPFCMNPFANATSPNGTLPGLAFSGVPYLKSCQPNESHGCFHGRPCYHQAFNVVPNTILNKKAPNFLGENHVEIATANLGLGPAQKRFLVFDQSGDQTTLFLSPGVNPPAGLTFNGPRLNNDYNLNKMLVRDAFQHPEPILTDVYNGKQRDGTQSEMHEDTEELNALLYSDDDYYEDEEETSTGHSPSTMTVFDKQESPENDDEEEVVSNFGPNKRMKLFNGGYEVSPLKDTASSVEPKKHVDCEDDAESSCGEGNSSDFGEFGLLGGKKRSRKDQIRETVSLLQSIIPGGKGKGKDAILIFDEAIDYLKSLKHKAEVLGVHTI